MQCPSIDIVTFSQRSRDAIDEIRHVDRFTMSLQRVTAGGVIFNIFVGNGPIEASYALSATDFTKMAEALAAMSHISRRRISNIAQEAALHGVTHQEREFWQAVVNGCKP